MASGDEKKLQPTRDRSLAAARHGFEFKPGEHRAVCPIVKVSKSEVMELCGTGFFVAPGGVFATAKHVFEIHVLPDDEFEVIQECADGALVRRPIQRGDIVTHEACDAAVLKLEPLNAEDAPCDDPPWVEVMRLDPEPEELVGSFVFSHTIVHDPETMMFEDGEDLAQRIQYRSHWEVGLAIETHADGHRLVKGRCHETSVFLEGRASGGPLFNSNGFVVGVNSTGVAEKRGAPNSIATSIIAVDELLVDCNT